MMTMVIQPIFCMRDNLSMKTGEFAKAAGVSEKTIRYYDKIGLLKPSKIKENGYREYKEADLLTLQKILLYKQLDFSLDEISRLIVSDDDWASSFLFQKDLVRRKIQSLRNLEEALGRVASLTEEHGSLAATNVEELIRLSHLAAQTADNYKNSSYLKDRILLHQRYSQNSIPWFQWIMKQIRFIGKSRILELGCGNGELWKYCNNQTLRNREVFLTDKSEGMVEEVRGELGREFNCITADATQIPFKDNYFDLVIANHVLFYLDDLGKGLGEVTRVLNCNGSFYCTTYGNKHMKEISRLCEEFDDRIFLSSTSLYEVFGAENGTSILQKHFEKVELRVYPDELIIDQPEDLINYILSCHGNQKEVLVPVIGQFKEFLEDKIRTNGAIHITKQAVLFFCEKPKKLV